MAWPNADAQTQNARCHCTGEQDGTDNLGHADETGRLPGVSVAGDGMIHAPPKTLNLVKEV